MVSDFYLYSIYNKTIYLNMSLNLQNTDYSLTNSQLYSPAFLARKAYKLFITIPHTDIDMNILLQLFTDYKQVIYAKVCQEHHEDGDTHLHIVLSFKAQVRYKSIHDIFIKASVGKRIIGSIEYQIPKSFDAVSQYLNKEGNVCEYGEKPLAIGKQQSTEQGRNTRGFKEAVIEAKKGNLEEAKEILLEHQTRDMLINGSNIIDNLKQLNLTREKFAVPIYNSDNTELRDWQKQLLDIVQYTPKERRIIWIHGEPETGKSFMFNYLSNLENYKYGIYNAGQCVSMDNLVYGYDEEGIIAWDFPMNFQFNDNTSLQGHIANVIEKFSDFGQSVSSKKYKGSNKVIRGHCVVFSNRPPLEELSHRDIVIIKATKQQKVEQVNKALYTINKAIRQDENQPVKIEIDDKANLQSDKAIPEFIKAIPEDSQIQRQNVQVLETYVEHQMEDSRKIAKTSLFNPLPDQHDLAVKKCIALRMRLNYLEENGINLQEQKLIIDRINQLEL